MRSFVPFVLVLLPLLPLKFEAGVNYVCLSSLLILYLWLFMKSVSEIECEEAQEPSLSFLQL